MAAQGVDHASHEETGDRAAGSQAMQHLKANRPVTRSHSSSGESVPTSARPSATRERASGRSGPRGRDGRTTRRPPSSLSEHSFEPSSPQAEHLVRLKRASLGRVNSLEVSEISRDEAAELVMPPAQAVACGGPVRQTPYGGTSAAAGPTGAGDARPGEGLLQSRLDQLSRPSEAWPEEASSPQATRMRRQRRPKGSGGGGTAILADPGGGGGGTMGTSQPLAAQERRRSPEGLGQSELDALAHVQSPVSSAGRGHADEALVADEAPSSPQAALLRNSKRGGARVNISPSSSGVQDEGRGPREDGLTQEDLDNIGNAEEGYAAGEEPSSPQARLLRNSRRGGHKAATAARAAAGLQETLVQNPSTGRCHSRSVSPHSAHSAGLFGAVEEPSSPQARLLRNARRTSKALSAGAASAEASWNGWGTDAGSGYDVHGRSLPGITIRGGGIYRAQYGQGVPPYEGGGDLRAPGIPPAKAQLLEAPASWQDEAEPFSPQASSLRRAKTARQYGTRRSDNDHHYNEGIDQRWLDVFSTSALGVEERRRSPEGLAQSELDALSHVQSPASSAGRGYADENAFADEEQIVAFTQGFGYNCHEVYQGDSDVALGGCKVEPASPQAAQLFRAKRCAVQNSHVVSTTGTCTPLGHLVDSSTSSTPPHPQHRGLSQEELDAVIHGSCRIGQDRYQGQGFRSPRMNACGANAQLAATVGLGQDVLDMLQLTESPQALTSHSGDEPHSPQATQLHRARRMAHAAQEARRQENDCHTEVGTPIEPGSPQATLILQVKRFVRQRQQLQQQ